MEDRELKVSEVVEFVDSLGQTHNALVTEVHGDPAGKPSVNLLWVSTDETKRDGYGRQIERTTSCVHRSYQGAHGMFWEFLT